MAALRWKRLALFCAGVVGIVTVVALTRGTRPGWLVVAAVVWVVVATVLGVLGRPSDDGKFAKPSV